MRIRGIAHRGYSSAAPENTLSSFQAACDLSFSHLEIDVHLSKDGIPVVIHDESIERVSDGRGFIKDYTVNELKKFRIRGTETIPTLEETLETFKSQFEFIIELKQEGNLYPGLEEAALDVIRRSHMINQSRIISFDHFSLAKVRSINSEIELGMLCTGSMPYVFEFMKQLRCSFLGLNHRFITPEYAEMMRENKVINNPGVVNQIEDMKRVVQFYPEALVTTDELERWSALYQSSPELQRYGTPEN